MKPTMLRKWKWQAVAIGGLLGMMQFVRPESTNASAGGSAASWASDAVSPAVAAIFERACQDCHSDRTRWPWYGRVAPVSWLLASHVNQGRKKLNLSEYGAERRLSQNEMEEACDSVERGTMPPVSYRLLHWNAWLTRQDVETICGSAQNAAAAAGPAREEASGPR